MYPDVGPSDADRSRTHAQRFADVGAAAQARVHQDRPQRGLRPLTIDALPEIIEAVNGRIPLGVPPADLTPRHSASSQHRYRVGSLFAAVRDAANKSRTCERESCGNCFLV